MLGRNPLSRLAGRMRHLGATLSSHDQNQGGGKHASNCVTGASLLGHFHTLKSY